MSDRTARWRRRLLAGLAVTVAAAAGVSAATAAQAAEAHQDNPFVGATSYVNPDYASLVDTSIAQTSDATLKAKMQTVKTYPTAVWLDRIAAITGGTANAGRKSLADHLNLAVAQKKPGQPITATFVVYDLPGRDCAALASNGELPLTAAGLQRYKTEYIDAIADVLDDPQYADVRIITVIEPDGLPNLVTNVANDPECQTANSSGIYVQGVQYALNKLHAIPNVYTYLDIAHSGWLGWDNNLSGTVNLFTTMAQGTTAGLSSVDGVITNTSNYTPTAEPFLTDPNLNVGGNPVKSSSYYEWNPQFDESHFTAALYSAFQAKGWPSGLGLLVDTSRNGWGGSARPTAVSTSTTLNTYVSESKVDRRLHRGLWCNVNGAGLGAPPQAAPSGFPSSHLDAFVWVKPPGESDGASSTIPNDEGKLADPMCDPTHTAANAGNNPTGAMPNAPLAGHWFHNQFAMLVGNANPAVPVTSSDTVAPSTPTGLAVSGKTSNSISLTWSASTDTGGSGLAGYRVFRGTTQVGSPTGTSFTDTGLAANTAYSYTVQALDGAGNTSTSSSSVSATANAQTDTTAPSVPSGLSVSGTTTSSVSLTWSASTDTGGSGLAGYRVFRGSTQVGTPTGTSYTDSGLAAGTGYTYTVKAIDGAGNLSAASAAVTGTTSSTPPATGDWLHTSGNKIVDANGNEVWLTGANWFGFNASERVFHGLWSGNITSITKSMADRGINLVRVPISTQLILEWKNGQAAVPSGVNTYANPELVGKTTLGVWDYWLGLCEQYGIKVMLDVHSAEADNSGHIYPVWYKGSITSEQFYQAWEWITDRYRNNDTVVAMDVKNEPHGKQSESPRAKWDNSTDPDNFKNACQTAGNRILAINPNVLIMCEGIEIFPKNGTNWTSTAETDYYSNWWGGNLRGVQNFPVNLGANQDQLVYSPHDYGPLVFNQPWFQKPFDKASLTTDVWRPNWLYIYEGNTAPLLIGEWGGRLGVDAGQDKWMTALRDLIVETHISQTFWCLNPNSGDTGGLLLDDWATWDETKYNLLKSALWSYQGKFVGLDHTVKLGGSGSTTGMSLNDRYGSTSDTTPPSVPGGLTVTGTTSSSISLSWSSSTDTGGSGLAGYRVFRGSTQVGTPTGTSFTDTGLTASTAYTYTVKAIDGAGNLSAASSSVTGTTTAVPTDTTPPSVPSGLTVTGTTSSSISLSWSSSTDTGGSGLAGYRVFRGSTQVGTPTGTSFTDTGLTAGTAYTYTVKATDGAGNLSAASAPVTGTTSTTPPPGGVKVQYKNNGGTATDGEIRPGLQLVNTGSSALSLSTVKVRYYFTREGSASVNVFCDYAQVGCGSIQSQVVLNGSGVGYVELSFTGGSIAAGGSSGEIQLRLAKSDWSSFDETNDYSYGTGSSFADSTKVTAYVGGALSWGVAPY